MSTESQESARVDRTLSAPQLQAIATLLAGGAFAEAARAAKVDPATIWRWRHQSIPFRLALGQGQAEIQHRIRAGIALLADKALDAIAHVLDDPMAEHTDRLRAALAVLDRLQSVPNTEETDERWIVL